ncbi:MAG: response regulator transcription factor, partial [Bacteroidales bacterium]|nr:response regulator transcription factor [Bacteroidales bacterium]
ILETRKLKLLITRYNHIKVIAITAYEEKVYLKELIENGFKACIFKSMINVEIEKTINTVMNSKLSFPDIMRVENDEV